MREQTTAWDKRAPYTHDEVQTLLAAGDARMRALLLLCSHGGLRISEVLDLRWAEVRSGAQELIVQHGKGGRQRRVVMGESLISALTDLPRREHVIGGSDPAAVERLQRLCARAGVPCRGHHVRHYAGTRLTREGASLDDVARHLGHAALETARIYAKWSDDGLRRRLGRW